MDSLSEFHQDKYRILKETFGFDEFRPGQEPIVDALLNGESILAVMPTGAGKSLCFQIPAMVMQGLTIVVSPLVALMQDQVSALRLAGVAAETINSSKERYENVDAWRRISAGESKILYMAPERLMTERMLSALCKLPVKLIAVDEAHCIAQWGPSFRPEYEGLSQLKEIFPNVPLAALTATADESTRNEIETKLFGGQGQSFVSGFDRPNIHLSVEMKSSVKQQLLRFVDRHAGESGIIYCLSRAKTESMAKVLVENGIRALPYHAGMDKRERDNNQDIFMTEKAVVMVATIAFGMGIDKPDVRFVAHTDLPGSMEAYYQEFGRAGRDGKPARAKMFYGLDDIRMRRVFIEQENSSDERKRREHMRLNSLIGYCESPQCRRSVLLAYFAEATEPCGNCDVCLDPVDLLDGAEVGQAILSTIQQTNEMFGAAHIIDILCGAKNEKIRKFNHDELSTFGTGTEIKKEQWRSIIRQLVAGTYLNLDIQGYGGLSLTDKGDRLLKGEEIFQYRNDTTQGAAKQRKKTKAPRPDINLTAEDETLLDSLKQLRLTLAKEKGVPAYVIFPDRTLEDMSARRPQNLEEFAEVHGVGESKLEKFGEVFLEVITR
ncbi:MAG: DNA helicase RecQ [Rhodospirillales bacterium]|nr:DNA helicase RecQ [Rhodospirillales bacterium]